jgi:hypothetical protein
MQIDKNYGVLKGWIVCYTYEGALIRSIWSPK